MAEGGVTTRPTLRLIGERGPEAVIPLSKAKGLGGMSVNLSFGDIVTGGGIQPGTPEFARMVGRIVTERLMADAALKASTRRVARGGL